MGVPNIQQQLYLKTALNESKDGMFDHPADLDEATKGSHKNVMRLDKAFRKSFDKNPKSAETERLAGAASLADKKLDAKELRRGGASERTMRRRINQDKWSEGWGAKNRFEREGQKKRRAALKAKGIAEALEHPADLDEGYHKKSLRLIRAGDWERAAEQGDRAEASSLMRGGASKRTMKAHFNKQDYAAGTKAQQRFDKAAAKKRDAALKAKGIAEALEEKLEEGYQAKRMRIIRKYGRKQLGSENPLSPKLDDFMKRSFKKKRQREERISGGKGSAKAMEVSARKKTAAMKEKGLAEGSLGLKSVLRKGKHNVGKYDKHTTKNAVRELVSRGRDPNNIKIYGTRGIENFGFQVNANVKREKALKAKGLLPSPKPLSPEASASAARIGRLSRQRRGMGY